MKQTLFSVVIATYNCGHKLAATIESVLAQQEELYEMIVVDGGSTDRTEQVVAGYDGQFDFRSEADRGVYDAFNKGVKMTSGKYILFLGAGDRLKEGVLKRVAEGLPDDELSFVYGNAYLMQHDKYYGGEFGRKDSPAEISANKLFFMGEVFLLSLANSISNTRFMPIMHST